MKPTKKIISYSKEGGDESHNLNPIDRLSISITINQRKELKMPWDDDFEAYVSDRKNEKSKENEKMSNLQIGDYVWSTKGCRVNGPTGGRILEFTTWRNYEAAKVRKADMSVKTFLTQNLEKIHRRTFDRRTGVSSLPLKA